MLLLSLFARLNCPHKKMLLENQTVSMDKHHASSAPMLEGSIKAWVNLSVFFLLATVVCNNNENDLNFFLRINFKCSSRAVVLRIQHMKLFLDAHIEQLQ